MIEPGDVERIARLARIRLGAEEIERFGRELSGILAFVAELGSADTSAVEPLSGGTELRNVTRDDALNPQRSTANGHGLIGAAPRKRDGYVEVEAVFERE